MSTMRYIVTLLAAVAFSFSPMPLPNVAYGSITADAETRLHEHSQEAESYVWEKESLTDLYRKGVAAMSGNDKEKGVKMLVIVCARYNESAPEGMQRVFADSFLRIGDYSYSKGDYASAIDYYLKARAITDKYDITDMMSEIYSNIGNVFAISGDLQSAQAYFQKALSFTKGKDSMDIHHTLMSNLFYIKFLENNPDSAEFYLKEMKDSGNRNGRAYFDLLLSKGLLSQMRSDFDSAHIFFKDAAQYAVDSLSSKLYLASAVSHTAMLFEKDMKLDSAMSYLLQNENLARQYGYIDLLMETLHDLARVSELCGDSTRSMHYKSEYLTLSDSIFSRSQITKIKNSQRLYEQESSATTIRILNSLNSRQRIWIFGLTGVILLVAAMAIILYKQKRKLSRAWNDLYRQNQHRLSSEHYYSHKITELEKALAEKKSDCVHNEEEDSAKDDESPAIASEVKNADNDDVENVSSDTSPSQGHRRLITSKEQRAAIVAQIISVMENTDDYCSPDYSIDRLAASIGSNARYVSEVINEEFGMNFRALLNKYRIKKSMIRLSDIDSYGHLTIKAIAESVGYKSMSTFISVFTRQTGLKPSLYQSLARDTHRKES